MFGKRWMTRGSILLLVVFILVQMTSCGYILYPERRGQTGGRIDPGIAILDAVGLLFFIIPGVVAFAVDFSSGAIYFPPHRGHSDPGSLRPEDTVVVRVKPGEMDQKTLEAIVAEQVGKPVHLDAENVRIFTVDKSGRFIPRDEDQPVPYVNREDS